MDITAVRQELAGLLPGQVYASIPGDPNAPCTVVGLPDEVRWQQGTYGLVQVRLPIWVVGGKPYEAKSEATALSMIDTVLQAIRTHPAGESYAAVAVENVDRVGTQPVGPNEMVAAAINLIIHLKRTTPES